MRHKLYLDSPTQVGKNRITLPKALADYYGNTAQAYVNGRQVESQTGGYALSFDGTDDYVNIGNDSSLNSTSEYSIRAIYEIDSKPNDFPHVFGAGTTGNRRQIYHSSITEVLFRLTVSGSEKTLTATISSGINTICGTYDGSTLKLYVNGELEDSLSTSGNVSASDTNQYIGHHPTLGVRYFDGTIYELSIWSRALSESETIGSISSETGLVAYYKMNEGSGTTLTDSAGSNNGTITGATWEFSEEIKTDNLTFTTPTPTREIEIGRGNLELTDTSSANEVGVLHWTPSSESGYYWVLTEDASGNTVYLKHEGTWVEGQLFIKVDGSWKQASDINVKASGTWK